MADVVPYNQGFADDDFITEILPSAEKTSLLFHLSYLCLAGFPELERLLRAKATDCRQLFSSSEALLLQCASTSDNMVNTLIPMLKAAIEKNKPVIAVRYLEKARHWIEDIIKKVEDTVEKYEKMDKDVGSAASDVILTKSQTEQKQKDLSQQMKSQETQIKTFEDKLSEETKKIENIQNDINAENSKLQKTVEDIANRNRKFGIAAAVVPIIGLIIDMSQKMVNEPKDKAAIETSKLKLDHLYKEKALLSEKQWKLESELLQLKMSLSKLTFDAGSIPDPVHLKNVQECLTKIQGILLKLKGFWETTGVMLDNLKGKTFAGEDMLEDLDDFKTEILESLEVAQKAWKSFGFSCMKVRGTFSVQSKDAYKFLEVDPSSLSKEEWQKEYDLVQSKMNNLFNPAIKDASEHPDDPAAIKAVP